MNTSWGPKSLKDYLRLTEAVVESLVVVRVDSYHLILKLTHQFKFRIQVVVGAKLILWNDISGQERPWLTHEEAISLEPILMRTVGYIIHEDDEKIVVCSTMDTEEEHYGNLNAIPRGVILAMRDLGVNNDRIDTDGCTDR